MSTAFFWDKGQKKFICERRGIGLEGNDFGKDLTFIFNSPQDVIKLFATDKENIIYDEYGVAWTVDSLIYQISQRGCIIIVWNYWKENGRRTS